MGSTPTYYGAYFALNLATVSVPILPTVLNTTAIYYNTPIDTVYVDFIVPVLGSGGSGGYWNSVDGIVGPSNGQHGIYNTTSITKLIN